MNVMALLVHFGPDLLAQGWGPTHSTAPEPCSVGLPRSALPLLYAPVSILLCLNSLLLLPTTKQHFSTQNKVITAHHALVSTEGEMFHEE